MEVCGPLLILVAALGVGSCRGCPVHRRHWAEDGPSGCTPAGVFLVVHNRQIPISREIRSFGRAVEQCRLIRSPLTFEFS